MRVDPPQQSPLTSGRATEATSQQNWPEVSVVIPTYNRPDFMRKALASVVAQDYPGELDILVVFDKTEPDTTLESSEPGRTVRVLANNRTPGLAGNRNTGILASRGELVAFCDDDDTWRPNKLTVQVSALLARPEHDFVTTAMSVDFGDHSSVRLAGRSVVDHAALVRSRMAMLHSSSFVARRSAFVGVMGLIEEALPNSMAEDRELLLRASRLKPILHVDEPLIDVRWGATSYFAQQWNDRNEAELWMLSRYPELVSTRAGAGMTYGKLAFGFAATGSRREALRWLRKGIAANPREPRNLVALAVIAGLPWQWVLRRLSNRGRGI